MSNGEAEKLALFEAAVIERLGKIERRLPDDMAEYPIDRHLREIRDELHNGLGELKRLLWERRNGDGSRDGVIPGLNRVEDRVDAGLRLLWAIFVALILGFGSLGWAMLTDFLHRAHP